MELQELYQSKALVNGAFNFDVPEKYIEPFIEKVQSLHPVYNIEAIQSSVNKNEDDTENIAYGRVLVEAKIPNYETNGFLYKMGILYRFDTSKPIMKSYVGTEVRACTNTNVYGADSIYEVSLSKGYETIYSEIEKYVESAQKRFKQHIEIYEKMSTFELNTNSIHELFGKLLEKGIKNPIVGTSQIMAAYKSILTRTNKYFYKEENNKLWNVWNAITDEISHDSNPIDRFNKIQMISDIILN